MSNLFDEMAADAAEQPKVDLSELTALAAQQVELQQEISALEQQTKDKKAILDELSGRTIPDAMASVGVTKLTLNDGATLEVKPSVQASITHKNMNEAYAWLRRNGFGDLIKNVVALSFGRGDDDLAAQAKDQLDQLGLPYEQKQTVHPQTLKAFVREQVEEGTNIPQDLFSIHIGQKTVIK